jgi:serine/threonine-protein kinase SBK
MSVTSSAFSSPRSSTSENLLHLELNEHYDVMKDLGTGTYGKVVLAECKDTRTQVALKLISKSGTKFIDFQREFFYTYYLSPHRAIVNTFDVSFETSEHFVFAQEYAPLGDLFDIITPMVGLSEYIAKNVMRQVTSALEFMHSKCLVHRDIKPENILVFEKDCSRIKLVDFGMTRKVGTMVRKTNQSIPYSPPEVCEAVRNENYSVECSADVWGSAVLLFCMVTGNFPWENANIDDAYFCEFNLWQRRKTVKIPSQWRQFTPRLMRLFRKMLEQKPERRCGIKEVNKYMEDMWTVRSKVRSRASDDGGASRAEDGHLEALTDMMKKYGIETKINKQFRKKRVCEWVMST